MLATTTGRRRIESDGAGGGQFSGSTAFCFTSATVVWAPILPAGLPACFPGSAAPKAPPAAGGILHDRMVLEAVLRRPSAGPTAASSAGVGSKSIAAPAGRHSESVPSMGPRDSASSSSRIGLTGAAASRAGGGGQGAEYTLDDRCRPRATLAAGLPAGPFGLAIALRTEMLLARREQVRLRR